ncbi:MAG: ABC transporter substrate-binding protein, partial [Endozoicomonas sp.]
MIDYWVKILTILLFLLQQAIAAPITNNTAINPPLKVALMPVFSSSPIFIADDYHYFSDEQLTVEYLFMSSAQNVAIAVATGKADIGVTGLTAGFFNLSGEVGLKIIAGQYQEKKDWNGAVYLACNQAYEKGLTSPEQLKGKRLGMTQPGSTFHRWYGALAEMQGWPITQFELISLHSLPGMISALSSCQVDAMIALPQIAEKLTGENRAHTIGNVSDYTPGQVGVVFSSSTFIQQEPTSVERFLRAYVKSSELYHDRLILPDQRSGKKAKKLL